MIPSWQMPLWQRITAAGHDSASYLLHAPPGYALTEFAERFAHWLLCRTPLAEGACQDCPNCALLAAGNMPDLMRIPGPEDKPVIAIDQIRALQEFTQLHAHQGGRRVAMLFGAETMKPPAQNALLKTLEEPPSGMHILLLSQGIGKLLPTIRSRTVVYDLRQVDAEAHRAWLAQRGDEGLSQQVSVQRAVGEWFERNRDTTGQLVREHSVPLIFQCLARHLSGLLRGENLGLSQRARLSEVLVRVQTLDELVRTNNLNAEIQLQGVRAAAWQVIAADPGGAGARQGGEN
ncbi:MAG: hypothetical protein ISN29_03435 [Gammaproteobacteria bacterium AqS3]|nr:hypothetical protein [Gammaproteobacteria bacterium AqS3]